MSEHKHRPLPVPQVIEDELTFKSCCTEVFRWVRSGIELAEESPAFFKGLADDVEQAWKDSARK